MEHEADLPIRKHSSAIPALLTTKQAARILGVSASFLERDRWEGARIPFVKVGARAVRYDPQSLAEYLRSRIHKSTSDSRRRP